MKKITTRASALNRGFTLTFVVLLFLLPSVQAQEFGGNPPSLKWKQVNTPEARIIFPATLDSLAREVSGVISELAASTAASLGPVNKKIDIVLQNQPTYSNGYVALAPFRSEFYLTPRQNSFELGSLPWHKKLALHEYRHVQQFNNFRRGISRIAYYVFGEEGQALANSTAIPDWFWEGDAVYQETIMSRQGRGRLPYFFNGFRSLWASGKNYSWMKLRNGSYRDYVPDHYQLGYMLVNYGYHQYGPETWKKITSDAAAFKGIFYPFQKSFRRHTGESFNQFTRDAFEYYTQGVADKIMSDSASAFASAQKDFAGDELYPQWINDTQVVYLKSSFSRIPAFYIRNINEDSERKLRVKAVSTSNYFSASGGRLVYSSFTPDARWRWRNYENITVVDIATGKEKTITRQQRYLSPSLSKDGQRIVAVRANTDGSHQMHVLDATSGDVIKIIPATANYIYTYPVFYSHDSVVSAVRDPQGAMALGLFSIVTGEVTWLTPFSMNVIAFPSVHQDTVYFSRSSESHDKLYACINGTEFEFVPSIPNNTTGNYLLSTYNGRYAWSTFTAAGYRLQVGEGSFRKPDTTDTSIYPLHEPPTAKDIIARRGSTNLKVTPYSAGYRLFNFHSWRPYFSDPEYSYSLVSNNILNTLISEVYFTYNRNERFKEAGALLSYAALYPVISGGASYTFDRSFTDTARRVTWNEFNARVGLNVPLQFTNGSFSQSLNAGASFNTKQVFYTGDSKELFDTKRFNYGEWSFSIVNQQMKARQNIYPRMAQSFAVRYRRILNNYSANQLLLSGSIYLPGLMRNHNLVVQLAWQRRDTLQQYIFPNSFPVSRGYPDIDYPRMWKYGFNYHLPLFYPDQGFGNIVYLLRVRANFFYDFSRVKSLRTGRTFLLDAAGSELFFDTRWWNQLPVSFGVRYSRLLDAGQLGISPNKWEIILPVNIFSR